MIPLIITFFLSIIIALIFILIKKEDILYVIKNGNLDEEDFTDRYAGLSDDQINFYFEQGQRKLENILRQRDTENSSLLGHAAIAIGAFSLFFVIGKWALHNHADLVCFVPLVICLSFAFLNMVLSILSMFQAYRLPYMLPAQIYDIPQEHINTDIKDLKEMFLERLVGDAKKNALSNERKIRLLDHSRTFLLYGLAALGVAFVYICCKLYLSFIIS
ncbi:MAG: hypothetical protein VZQ98_15055 [Bacteroidales bacterium]|nr:hypothetical protein [Bacteroidales bacterium]